MKVGRETAVIDAGLDGSIVVYATNMVPAVLIIPPWISEDARKEIIAIATKDYEKKRRWMVERYGELELVG